MTEDPFSSAKKNMDGIVGCSCCVVLFFIAGSIAALVWTLV